MIRTAKKVQLPLDFAGQLLECEIEYRLSEQPSKQTVKSLVELYSIGVEYYQSIRSHKYLYFQLKMNEVFMSASALFSINESTAPKQSEKLLRKKLKPCHEEDKILAIKIKQKQQKIFQEVSEQTSEKATITTVKKMINDNDLKRLVVQQKVNKQIMSQEAQLKAKLERRKSKMELSRSFCSMGIIGETDTKDSLFADMMGNEASIIKPIQVNFQSIIKENESDEENTEDKFQPMASAPDRKIKSVADLFTSAEM